MTVPQLRPAPFPGQESVQPPVDFAPEAGGTVLSSEASATDPDCREYRHLPILKGGMQERLVEENFDRVGEVVDCLRASLSDEEVLSIAISNVTGLQTALNGKSNTGRGHAISDVTNLQTELNGKAAASHGHAIGDVTNLQTELNGKAASSHSHVIADTSGLQTALNGKASTSHTHNLSDQEWIVVDALTSDVVVNNSTTYVDALTCALAANAVYRIEAFIIHNSGATPDAKMRHTIPTGASGYYTYDLDDQNDTMTAMGGGATFNGAGADRGASQRGTITTAGTAGNLVLQIAQQTADPSDTKMVAGSWMQVTRLS